MGCFVLQNKNKQTIRTFLWDSSSLTLVYRKDHGRIEAVNSTQELDKEEIPYAHLLTTTKKDVLSKDISITGYGYLSYKENPTHFSPTFDLAEEESRLKKTFQVSAIVHVSLVAFLILLSFVVNRFFTKEKQEPVVVTIETQQPQVKEFIEPKKRETVKVAEKIINKKPVPTNVKKSNITRKIQPKKVTVVKNIPIRKDIPANRKGPNMNQMGVLGALSSMKKTNSSSLDLNGVGEGGRGAGGRGYGGFGNGGGGLGEGLKGGASGALPGKGLLASSPGSGSQAMGAGGYGSSGSGGGRHGLGGGISFRGKSGAFMAPLTEEASVESGLDRDQIAAVVQKNMGQIIYCYEMGLQSKPDLKGRLTAHWVINGRGLVNTSQIAHSSVGDAKVEQCITSKIKNWKFPKPIGAVNVDVDYPFELRRVSQR
jgi:hypothetical protein